MVACFEMPKALDYSELSDSLTLAVGTGRFSGPLHRAWRMMNFRQRMGWIGVGLYLLASAAAFYYVFEINETYNRLALEHIQQHPEEPAGSKEGGAPAEETYSYHGGQEVEGKESSLEVRYTE